MTQTPRVLTNPPDKYQSDPRRDALTDALSMIRLAGAIFLRAEFTTPWAYESPPSSVLARVFNVRADRHILFHIIAEGQCWIRLGTGDPLEVSKGDIIVLPYGEQHVVGSPESTPAISIARLLSAPPWKEFPVVQYGGGGVRTTMVCGYLHCEDPIFDPILRALPPLFKVSPPAGPAAAWVAASVQYALDAAEGRGPATSAVALRLPELLFSEVLRLYIDSNPSVQTGWLAALRDPVVGPALLEIHAEPAFPWTVDELARRTAYSRSTITERFGKVLGRAPMQYLTDWRIHLAADLLRDSKEGVATIASRVGYESEEAFNRAFKRAMGSPPAQWRRQVVGG